jgi:hypothetical protein
MADDARLGLGDPSGPLAAAEDIAGRLLQRLKLVIGAYGVDGGDVSNENPMPVKFAVASASFGSRQSSATGATFVALDAAACIGVEIKNTRPASVDIEVRRGGSGATVCIPAGGADYFGGLTNASGLQIRRYDQLNTQVTVDYEVRA